MDILKEKCTPGFNLYSSLQGCKANDGTQINCSKLVCKSLFFICPSTTGTACKWHPQSSFPEQRPELKGQGHSFAQGETKQMHFEISSSWNNSMPFSFSIPHKYVSYINFNQTNKVPKWSKSHFLIDNTNKIVQLVSKTLFGPDPNSDYIRARSYIHYHPNCHWTSWLSQKRGGKTMLLGQYRA